MPDTTRVMREGLEISLADAHRAAAPEAPDSAALARVRARAEGLTIDRTHAERPRWRQPLVLRIAAVVVVVLVALGVSLAVLRPGDSAFARDKLLAVLAPEGTIVHYVERVSGAHAPDVEGASGSGTFEHWIDAEAERRRTEMGLEGEEPTTIEIESGGRLLTMGPIDAWPGDPRFAEPSAEGTSAGAWYVLETPNDEAYSGNPDGFNPFFQLDMLREAVADERAEVVGNTEVNGDPCWEVEWRIGPDNDPLSPVGVYTAVVRKSDYRPVRTSIVVMYDGVEQQRFETEVTLWEELPAASIDPAVFERWNLPVDVAYEQRVYSPEDLADFNAFDAWWLGPEFEGRAINGMIAVPLEMGAADGAESLGTLPEITYARGQGATVGWLPFADQGELSMTYTEGGLLETSPSDVRVIVLNQQDATQLEALLRNMSSSSVTPGLTGAAAAFAWREEGGRRYFERLEEWAAEQDDRPSASSLIGAREQGSAGGKPEEDEPLPQAGTTSTAILNLGNATVLVITPDSETTARAIAALAKPN